MGEVNADQKLNGLYVKDVHLYVERLARTINSVCCVEINEKAAGTGFLVGPSVVLTNHHVIAMALEPGTSRRLRHTVTCRFDYQRVTGGGIHLGTSVGVDPDCLDISPASQAERENYSNPFDPAPTDEELDFALLRLATDVGNRPVAGSGSDRRRGWINFPGDPETPKKDEFVIIVQHQLGGPPSLDQRPFIAANAINNRYRYDNRVTKGSSGSPCLTQTYDLVAIHHLGDAAWGAGQFSQGVPARLIRKRLMPAYAADLEEFVDTRQIGNADAMKSFVTVVRSHTEASSRALAGTGLIREAHLGTQRLKLYKAAHDFLQTAQKHMAQIDDLLRELEVLERTQRQLQSTKDEIQRLGATLKLQCSQPRAQLNLHRRLEPDLDPQLFEWIDEIAANAGQLECFATIDRKVSRLAVVGIQDVLRFNSAELNRDIIEQIAALPFDALRDALAKVSEALAVLGGEQAFDVSPQTLHQVWQQVKAESRDHTKWQVIENQLIELRAQLRADSTYSRENFEALWQRMSKSVTKLCEAAVAEDWSVALKRGMAKVDAAIARPDWAVINAEYATFRRLAEDRFSEVDKNLLSGCEDIVRMSDQLAILAR